MDADAELLGIVNDPPAFAPLTTDEEDRIVGSMVREQADLTRRIACLRHRLDRAGQDLSSAACSIERFCADDSDVDLPDLAYADPADVVAQARLLSETAERARAINDRITSC